MIEDISLGGRTAEEESQHLARYFVETEQWRKVWEDEVDIVFAPKGGGKSAIYSMLVSREGELFDRGIVLVAGENPTGESEPSLFASERHLADYSASKPLRPG